MRRWSAFFDGILNTLAAIAGVFIVLMTVIECYEVIARYFLKRPPIWGVEFCEYMLYLVGFLGTAWALREKSHISVSILRERMKPKTRAYCDLFACSLGILISLIILWYSLKTSWQCYVTDVKVVKTMAQPKWIFLSFISLGYFLLLIEFGRQFVAHLRILGDGQER